MRSQMDAIQFLKQEHQKANAAFAKVLRASPAARGHLWTKLQPVLEIHEKIEDAHLYGPFSHDAGKMDSKLAAWRKRHQNEVDKVEGLMEDMAALAPEDAPWLAKLKTVPRSPATDIRGEEEENF